MRLIKTGRGKKSIVHIDPDVDVPEGARDVHDALAPAKDKTTMIKNIESMFERTLNGISFLPKRGAAVEYYDTVVKTEQVVLAIVRKIVKQRTLKIGFYHKYLLEHARKQYVKEVHAFLLFLDDGSGLQYKKYHPVLYVKLITAVAAILEQDNPHDDETLTEFLQFVADMFKPITMRLEV